LAEHGRTTYVLYLSFDPTRNQDVVSGFGTVQEMGLKADLFSLSSFRSHLSPPLLLPLAYQQRRNDLSDSNNISLISNNSIAITTTRRKKKNWASAIAMLAVYFIFFVEFAAYRVGTNRMRRLKMRVEADGRAEAHVEGGRDRGLEGGLEGESQVG
jgi:hypothetical protein